MRLPVFLRFAAFGLSTIVFRRTDPILGTIILTDRCNLTCKHCAVSDASGPNLPYEAVRAEMETMYAEGIRILFFCGGETFLWHDSGRDLLDLVREAKSIGFPLVNVVTNGTISACVPGADIVFLSIDGMKDAHDAIRGPTFDLIMANLEAAKGQNTCVYMAINAINHRDIRPLTELVAEHPSLRSISFNFHTPYPGTESLALDEPARRQAIDTIRALMTEGYPIFNLPSALDAFLANDWPRPCRQCVVSSGGKRFVCGRCVELPGLCERCGYLFAAEFSLLFRGDLRAIRDMLRIYRRFA